MAPQPSHPPTRACRGTARVAPRLLVTAVALAAGCSPDRLLDADAPDVIGEAALENPAGAEALRAGAVGLLAGAVAGAGGAGLATYGGTFADEFVQVQSTVASAAPLTVDLRTPDDAGTLVANLARPLHNARLTAMQAVAALGAYAPAPASRVGEAYAVRGYAEVLLAEHFCSGMPLGGVRDGRLVTGPPLATRELLERAAASFDTALALAGDSARVAHLARVGRGRALLGLGRLADAAASVRAVPTTYAYTLEYGDAAARQRNGVFVAHAEQRGFSVANREGGNGLDFAASGDPRVGARTSGRGADGVSPLLLPARPAARTTAMPLATGVEARLIEAEAQLASGGSWLATLNALRAGAVTPALAPLADPGAPDARLELTFRERALWLFGTAHRLGDLRRLIAVYDRAPSRVFPIGAYGASALTYGEGTALPVPAVDRGAEAPRTCTEPAR